MTKESKFNILRGIAGASHLDSGTKAEIIGFINDLENISAEDKFTDDMEKDAETCSCGEAIDCADCSCHVCMAGQY